MQERRELQAGHRGTPFPPIVVHPVQKLDISRSWNTDAYIALRVRHEHFARRTARHLRRNADADRGVGSTEIADPRGAVAERGQRTFLGRLRIPTVQDERIAGDHPDARAVQPRFPGYVLMIRRFGRAAELLHDESRLLGHRRPRVALGMDRRRRQPFQPEEFPAIRDP